MAATPTLFSLLVHHGPTISIIHNADRNQYSYMDMCQDVLEIGLVDLPANINIKREIPNSMDIINVNNDINMLHMFDAYEDEGCHKIHILFHLHLRSLNALLINPLKNKL